MTPALGTKSREADHPGRVSGMKVGMSPKGLDSELRILSPSFKGPVCSFPALKPSEKGKPCLPSMCWIPLLLRRPLPRSLLEISVRALTSTCPQPRKTCGPSDHQVRASLVGPGAKLRISETFQLDIGALCRVRLLCFTLC